LVIVWNRHGGKNQRWNVTYLDTIKKQPESGLNKEWGFYINRPFYLRSRMMFRRIVEGRGHAEFKLRRYVKNRKEQQWIFHQPTKTIKSFKNQQKSIDVAVRDHMRMSHTDARWYQQWYWRSPYLVNTHGKVMSIHQGLDQEGQDLYIKNKENNKLYQQWDIVYVDQGFPDEPGKGDFNEDFGLYIERPFYIISELPQHRYLDIINNRNLAIKTRNGRNTQEWYFHQQSLTIRTKSNNQSWDIHNSGRSNHMQVWSTNSNWW
jgi:hypothetical protein